MMKRVPGSKGKKRIRKAFAAVFVLMIINVAANAAAICMYAETDETRHADAAIILGAAVWNDTPSPVFRERINHGIRLYQEGYVDKLIFTGGYGEGSLVSDAQIAMNYAVQQGVPPEDIWIEEKSKITQENLYYARQIMQENGLEQVLIVSDPLHMKRAMRMAKDLEIAAYSSPTTTSRYQSVRAKAGFLGREVFFYFGYKLVY